MISQRNARGPRLSSVNTISKPILTPRDAIASHVRWKIALLLAARMREPLSPGATRSIEHPEECSIGKWLASSQTLHQRGTPEYRSVVGLHNAFHVQMLHIAKLLAAGQFDQAEAVLNAPEPFQSASNALANAIMAMGSGAASRPYLANFCPQISCSTPDLCDYAE